MTYDNYGNIVSKNGKTYTYGNSVWKDLLTTCDGETITYDAQGNPTSYLGHTLTWEKGRQLKSFDNTQYTYNANGIRTSKTVNGVEHTFVLDGTKILKESWNGNTIIPMYDNEDNVCGIIYNDVPYYFFKNLQGDVIAIVDKDAQTVAKYSYDSWGVCTISQDSSDCNIASVNPFRYRGYYCDSEIGLYYLQSRYYNPTVGRFVNADELTISCLSDDINNINSFTYCKNNSITYKDPYGTIAIVDDIFVAGVALTAIVTIELLMYMSTPQFKSAWADFCSGLIGLLGRLWSWIKSLFMSAARMVENAISKSIEKATDVIRGKRWSDYYWIASSVSFKKRNVTKESYFPCMPISYSKAINYIRTGGDVFASSQSSAKKLAYAVGNGSWIIGPEIHGGLGYFWHYHAHRHIGRRYVNGRQVGGHIFFIFWG